MNRSIKTCYVSAPPGTYLTGLHASLAERGIKVIVPDEVFPGSAQESPLQQVLARCDLVIGVLTRERRSQWVLFELGQAAAMKRQIVLFAPPSSGTPPHSLAGVLVLRVNLRNRQAVDFALDQLLAAPPPTGLPWRSEHSEYHPLGAQADYFLSDLDTLKLRGGPRDFEHFIAGALRASGVDVIAESPEPERGADLAVWSDALESHVGNPLLVEIKSKIRDSQNAKDAMNQLASALQRSGGRWGLLLYGDGPSANDRVWKSCPPTVLVQDFYSFLESLRSRSFVEVIKDLRNRRVHGVWR